MSSFSKHLLSTYYGPRSVLGPEDTAANTKGQVPALTELTL